MEVDIIIYKTVTKAGSLEVFTKHEISKNGAKTDLPGYYWRDKYENCPQGPFDSIHNAMDNHVQHLEYRQLGLRLLPSLFEGSIIHLDFINKKRVGGQNEV